MKKSILATVISSILASNYVYASDAQFKSLGGWKQPSQTVFNKGDVNGTPIWRIPSLLMTQKGTLILAIDKRNQHRGDWGNIDTAIRISQDNGKSWSDVRTILDLPSHNNELGPIPPDNFNPWSDRSNRYSKYNNSAFLIDALMVQDKRNDRVFLAVDMFPESAGFFSINNDEGNGNGHIVVNNKSYLRLNRPDNSVWTLRENGEVYDDNNKKTEYTVVTKGNADIAYKNLGDVYKGTEKVGNIYLRKKDNNSDVPFTINQTAYFWITHSDDEGKTWSSPKDITAQVKKDWMRFFGTGPGVGIQTKSGNLILPIYYTNLKGAQSSALIISEDGGETWTLGESPNDRRAEFNGKYTSKTMPAKIGSRNFEITESQLVELENGDIKLFMRNQSGKVQMATSKDGGKTWLPTVERINELDHPYSQISVIKYSKKIDGKEYIILSGPSVSAPGGDKYRRNGKVFLGEVQEDGSIKWHEKRVRPIQSTGYSDGLPNGYVYSSVAELKDGSLGLAYENTTNYTTVIYQPLDMEEFFWQENKVFSDIRERQPRILSYNGEELLTKIGDGEVIKVGTGIHKGDLIINEGTVTLNQSANASGQKQAFKNITVNPQGTVRLNSADQINLSNLTLNKGTLDLNGQTVELAEQNNESTGLRSNVIKGNIINTNTTTAATLNYALSGNRTIEGNLGHDKGLLNVTYQPTDAHSSLTLKGDSVLNTLDVKSGSVIYDNNTKHKTNQAAIRKDAILELKGNTNVEITRLDLENSAKILINNATGQTTALKADIHGEGDLIKNGEGTLKLSGDASHHTGNTDVNAGTLELNGSVNNLTLGANAKLAGNAVIKGTSTWKNDSIIAPSLNQNIALPRGVSFRTPPVFVPNIQTFNHIKNEGAKLLLRIGNYSNQVKHWRHDQILVNGNVESAVDIQVNTQLLGHNFAKTDTNKNGKYDSDEGISLIQIAGNAKLGIFKMGQFIADNSPYQYTLVAVDKGDSISSENKLGTNDSNFYDYRLQAVLEDASGNPLNPVISSAEAKRLADEEAKRKAEEKAKKEADDAVRRAEEELRKAKTENEKRLFEQKLAEARERARKAREAEKNANRQPNNQPNSQNTPPASQDKRTHRAKLDTQVPAYLVSNTAMLAQGSKVRALFNDQFDTDAKGLYLVQDYSGTDYNSNLSFSEYGYGYKTKTHITALGFHSSVSATTGINTMVSLSNAKVESNGETYDKTSYKSVSALLGAKHTLGNFSIKAGVGYTHHNGKASNGNKVKGKQYQAFTKLGYNIAMGTNLVLTPTVGLGYQRLTGDIHDNNFSVKSDNHNVFSQYIGTELTYKANAFNFKASALYENNIEKDHYVQINQERFKTGELGNAVVINVGVEAAVTSNITLGISANHRLAVSDAKRKETGITAKAEYKF